MTLELLAHSFLAALLFTYSKATCIAREQVHDKEIMEGREYREEEEKPRVQEKAFYIK